MVCDASSRHAVVRLVLLVVVSASLLDSSSSSSASSNMTEDTEQENRPESVVSSNKDSRGLFSPRMEYDEWTPLGRGDPLKNDPTYDYVPPVLERVHYWIEPSSRTPDPPVPTLGHASKEQNTNRGSHKRPEDIHRESDSFSADSRRDVYDPFFMKFVEGPKFSSTNRNQHHYYHHYYRRPSSSVSQQSNSSPTNQRTHHHMPSFPLYHSTYQQKGQQKQRPFETHVLNDRHHSKQSHRTTLESPSQSADSQPEKHTFETPEFQNDMQNQDEEDQQPRPPYTILVPPPLQIPNSFTSMSDIQKPVQMPESNKATTQTSTTTVAVPTVAVEQSNLVYQFSTSSSPPPSMDWEEGKTQLATIAAPSSQVTWKSPTPTPTKYDKYPSGNPYQGPYSITTAHNLRNNPSLLSSPIVEVLPSTELQFNDSNNINFPLSNESSGPQEWTTTTVPSSTVSVTTSSSLTTDPLFSHYKQPVEPLRGPMYLIIQGHSKVKTYGAAKHHSSYHGIPIQETNEIVQPGSSDNKNDRIGKAMDDYDDVSLPEAYNSVNTEVSYVQDGENAIKTDDEFPSTRGDNGVQGISNYEDDVSRENSALAREKRQVSLGDVPLKENTAEVLEEPNQESSAASSFSRLKRSLSCNTP